MPKECGTYKSYDMDRSDVGKSSKPKSKRILLIKTEKNKPWDLALLLRTSTSELMKRDGVTRAYKNTHLSMGIV